MILSDRDIKKYLKEGKIKIIPKPDLKTQLGPCSIDLKLGDTFRIFQYTKRTFIDTKDKNSIMGVTRLIKIKKGEPLVAHPGEFLLAQTIESIEICNDLIGRLEGRSSLGRLGIVVHSTAARFDPGWKGKATLELGNLGKMPVALYPGMKICAFTFEQLSSKAEMPYDKRKSSKYKKGKFFIDSRIAEEK